MSDPGDKYRDRVDPQHKLAMDGIGLARQILATYRDQYTMLIEAERNAHNIGHITDPTLYRDMIYSKNFAWTMVLVRAAMAFLAATDAVVSEVMGDET